MTARHQNMTTPTGSRNSRLKRLARAASFVLVLANVVAAEEPKDQWDNLRTLRAGENIQVVDRHLKSLKGTLIGVSEKEISLRTESDEITLLRGDVHRVTALDRGHGRLRHALIGLAVGAGVGAASGASEKGNPDAWSGPIGAAIGAAGLGAIGFGVGAAVPPTRPTIYRQERLTGQVAP